MRAYRRFLVWGIPLVITTVLLAFWLIVLPASATPAATMDKIPLRAAVVVLLAQDWSDIGLITANDDWTGIPGITGYRGDGLTSATGADPQTILAASEPVTSVLANRNSPNTLSSGGVAEFEIADPAVALQGSGAADAPHLLIRLDTRGFHNLHISYSLRDLDASDDNALQAVALQVRLGRSADFTNLPAGFVADATTGPNLATQVTPVTVTLPTFCADQPEVQLRIITANASGSDEWVGVDDLLATGEPLPKLELAKFGPAMAPPVAPFTYTLLVTNATGQTIHDVTLLDALPAGVLFGSASGGGALAGGVVSWMISGALPPGVALTRTVTVIPAGAGNITNTAEVFAADWVTPTASGAVVTRVAQVEASLSLAAPALGILGDRLVYSVTLQTQGTLSASITLTQTLPAGVSYTADSFGVAPIHRGQVYTWHLPPLPPNDSYPFLLTTTVGTGLPGGSVLTSTIEIRVATDGDLDGNNHAAAVTTVYPYLSIYDLQFVAAPLITDVSPYLGQTVWVDGVVVAEPGEIGYPNFNFVIADPAGGPWSGLMVYKYKSFDDVPLPEGSRVRLLGTVNEYDADGTPPGMTELNIRYAPHAIQVLAASQPLPVAELQSAALAASAEAWEAALVELTNTAVITPNLGYGEWAFSNDGVPGVADDYGGLDGDLGYRPALGDTFTRLRGIFWYAYDAYKLEPRSDADIEALPRRPSIRKRAPAMVASGAAFTYTLTVANPFYEPLTHTVITDALPANLALAAALDGGTFANGVLTWEVQVPARATFDVRCMVTATSAAGSWATNQDYGFSAANWLTPTFGAPVVTAIGDYAPIPALQGMETVSPFAGKSVRTRGVVTGLFRGNSSVAGYFNGFFLQDERGDGDEATSDGIFVNLGTVPIPVAIGSRVELTGTVGEFDEYGGTACQENCVTQVRLASAKDLRTLGVGAVPPVVLHPPRGAESAAAWYESHEGMLVQLPNTGRVVGPTKYNTVYAIPSDEPVVHVLHGSAWDGMPFGVRHWERYGAIHGKDAPQLAVGSVITGVVGPLTWTYDGFAVITQADAPWEVVSSQSLPAALPEWPGIGSNAGFSVATFNAYNFDAAGTKLSKVLRTVEQLNGPTFMALQEISPTVVLTPLLDALHVAGYPYEAALSYPDDRGIAVALLWRSDQITQTVAIRTLQTCSTFEGDSPLPDPAWQTCRAEGLYPLFSRRPVVLNTILAGRPLAVVANHLKSQIGGELADARRLAQAQFLADFVAGLDVENVILLGDLNDYEDSAPLQALYASGLANAWYTLPPEGRYSYNFQGLSQAVDHILVSRMLLETLQAFGPLHLNADYSCRQLESDGNLPWCASDHDPLAATFTWRTDRPTPTSTPTSAVAFTPLPTGETATATPSSTATPTLMAGTPTPASATATPTAPKTATKVLSPLPITLQFTATPTSKFSPTPGFTATPTWQPTTPSTPRPTLPPQSLKWKAWLPLVVR